MKLLNIDANPKTVKGQARGYMTAVLYLSPWRGAGVNVCPMAEIAGCNVSCLNTAGRGGIAAKRATWSPFGVKLPDNAIQRARIARTLLFTQDRNAFMLQLVREIAAFCRKAERKGLTPCVRLNGTSDIAWESVLVEVSGFKPVSVFDWFPSLQFYDYTKLPTRLARTMPANYHLSLSWSGADAKYQRKVEHAALKYGVPLVLVRGSGWCMAYTAAVEALCERAAIEHIVDGDASDLRFLEPQHALVILKAKGLARKDRSGFVLQA